MSTSINSGCDLGSRLVAGGVSIGFDKKAGIDLPEELKPRFPKTTEYFDNKYGKGRWNNSLVLSMATQPDQIYRQYNENWLRSLGGIGVRVRFETMQFAECLKAARAGRLQMWFLGSTAQDPDGQGQLERMYGASAGESA